MRWCRGTVWPHRNQPQVVIMHEQRRGQSTSRCEFHITQHSRNLKRIKIKKTKMNRISLQANISQYEDRALQVLTIAVNRILFMSLFCYFQMPIFLIFQKRAETNLITSSYSKRILMDIRSRIVVCDILRLQMKSNCPIVLGRGTIKKP